MCSNIPSVYIYIRKDKNSYYTNTLICMDIEMFCCIWKKICCHKQVLFFYFISPLHSLLLMLLLRVLCCIYSIDT